MRKLVMSLAVVGGLLFVGTPPAPANAAAGLTADRIHQGEGLVEKTGWRHRRWRHRHWRGGGIYLGLPFVSWGYYPRYRYYNDYYPYYGGYYYRGPRWRHHRHWRGYRAHHRGWRRGGHRHWGHRGGHRRHR
jgi:hypothetical protein